MTPEQKLELARKQHHVPTASVNSIPSAIFAAETPLGHFLRFPLGTSLLGVLQSLNAV
jgi:hypothetical protein